VALHRERVAGAVRARRPERTVAFEVEDEVAVVLEHEVETTVERLHAAGLRDRLTALEPAGACLLRRRRGRISAAAAAAVRAHREAGVRRREALPNVRRRLAVVALPRVRDVAREPDLAGRGDA